MMFTAKAATRWSMAVLILGLGTHIARAGSSATIQAFDAPDGETYVAIALKAAGPLPQAQPPQRLVILMDTSASQVGQHREHGLQVLDSLLSSLPANLPVSLFAVDIQAIPLTKPNVTPQVVRETALPKLRQRFPAGSTDMRLALTSALGPLEGSQTAAVIYIGDGMSTANLIQQADMQSLMQEFCDRKVAVSSYAVGPRTDLQLLGILAHHSGGRVLTDEGMDQRTGARQIGQELASIAVQPVFYPTQMAVTPALKNLIPQQPLPVRADRETIYLSKGALPAQMTITLTADNQKMPFASKGEALTEGNTFLYGFYRQAVQNEGLNPLAGMELYREAQQGFEDEIARLEAAGEQAVVARDFATAEQLGLTIKNFDPNNVRAEVLIGAAGDLKVRTIAQAEPLEVPPAGADETQAPPFPDTPVPGDEPTPPASAVPAVPGQTTPPASEVPPAPVVPDSRLLQPNGNNELQSREQPLDQSLIDAEKDRQQIAGERLALEVSQVINSAGQRLGSDPLGARNDLQSAMQAVKSAPDIDADVRAQLLRRVNSAIIDATSRTAALEQRNIRAAAAHCRTGSTGTFD